MVRFLVPVHHIAIVIDLQIGYQPLILHMFLNPCGSQLLPIHVPLDLIAIHIHNHPHFHPIGYFPPTRPARQLPSWTVLPNCPRFGKISYQIFTLVRILIISPLLVDNPERKDLIADFVDIHDEVPSTSRRNNLLRQQLESSVFVYLLNSVAFDIVVIFQKFIVFVYCYYHLLTEYLLLCFVILLWNHRWVYVWLQLVLDVVGVLELLCGLYFLVYLLDVLADLSDLDFQLLHALLPSRNYAIFLPLLLFPASASPLPLILALAGIVILLILPPDDALQLLYLNQIALPQLHNIIDPLLQQSILPPHITDLPVDFALTFDLGTCLQNLRGNAHHWRPHSQCLMDYKCHNYYSFVVDVDALGVL